MNYTKEQLDAIWAKALKSSNEANEKKGFRKDMCGAWIKKDKHGEEGKYGWEVDHIYPKSKAEEKGINEEIYNDLINLQPLHHRNNGSEGKGDDYPSFYSAIVADGTNNIDKSIRNEIPEEIQNEIEEYFDL